MWRWRSPSGKTSAGGFSTQEEAMMDAVSHVTGKAPDPSLVGLLWKSAMRAGWCIYLATV